MSAAGMASNSEARKREQEKAPTVALDVETVADVVAEHSWDYASGACMCGSQDGGADHMAAAVLAADPRRTEAAVQTETLSEAADEMGETDMPAYVAEWLIERADRIGGDQ